MYSALKNKVHPMKPEIKDELLDELLKNYTSPEDLMGPEGLLAELKQRLISRVLDSELTTHLGYEKHEQKAAKKENARNGDFNPELVPKHQRHFNGFDDAIISLYSRGLSTREIQEHLKEIYKVEVSPMLISNATEAVAHEVKQWQNRSLDSVYAIVYFDAIVVKIRHERKVSNRAIYLALGINLEGRKEILGMWSSPTEGARF